MSLEPVSGRRSVRWWRKAVTVVEGCAGNIMVDGRPKPPKVETKTLRCFDSMLAWCMVSSVLGKE